MELVIAQFKTYVLENEQAGRHANGKTRNIDR
jgi:hypothetical protein